MQEVIILPAQGATNDRRIVTQGDAIGLGYARLSALPEIVRLYQAGIRPVTYILHYTVAG
jgi:hypothetical protein